MLRLWRRYQLIIQDGGSSYDARLRLIDERATVGSLDYRVSTHCMECFSSQQAHHVDDGLLRNLPNGLQVDVNI